MENRRNGEKGENSRGEERKWWQAVTRHVSLVPVYDEINTHTHTRKHAVLCPLCPTQSTLGRTVVITRIPCVYVCVCLWLCACKRVHFWTFALSTLGESQDKTSLCLGPLFLFIADMSPSTDATWYFYNLCSTWQRVECWVYWISQHVLLPFQWLTTVNTTLASFMCRENVT